MLIPGDPSAQLTCNTGACVHAAVASLLYEDLLRVVALGSKRVKYTEIFASYRRTRATLSTPKLGRVAKLCQSLGMLRNAVCPLYWRGCLLQWK